MCRYNHLLLCVCSCTTANMDAAILIPVISYFIIQNRIRRNKMHMLATLLFAIGQVTWPHTNKYQRKLGKRKRREITYTKRKQPCRNQGDILQVDIYERTGLFEDRFEELYQTLKEDIEKPRGRLAKQNKITSLCTRFRLLLVLHFLRRHLCYSTLKEIS